MRARPNNWPVPWQKWKENHLPIESEWPKCGKSRRHYFHFLSEGLDLVLLANLLFNFDFVLGISWILMASHTQTFEQNSFQIPCQTFPCFPSCLKGCCVCRLLLSKQLFSVITYAIFRRVCWASGDFAMEKKLGHIFNQHSSFCRKIASTFQLSQLRSVTEIVTSMATPLVQRPSTVSSKRPENLANKLSLDEWRLHGPRLEMGWESCWSRFFWTFFLFRGLPRELWGELASLKIGDEIDEFQ